MSKDVTRRLNLKTNKARKGHQMQHFLLSLFSIFFLFSISQKKRISGTPSDRTHAPLQRCMQGCIWMHLKKIYKIWQGFAFTIEENKFCELTASAEKFKWWQFWKSIKRYHGEKNWLPSRFLEAIYATSTIHHIPEQSRDNIWVKRAQVEGRNDI